MRMYTPSTHLPYNICSNLLHAILCHRWIFSPLFLRSAIKRKMHQFCIEAFFIFGGKTLNDVDVICYLPLLGDYWQAYLLFGCSKYYLSCYRRAAAVIIRMGVHFGSNHHLSCTVLRSTQHSYRGHQVTFHLEDAGWKVLVRCHCGCHGNNTNISLSKSNSPWMHLSEKSWFMHRVP